MRRRGVLHANGADDERALSSREGSGQAVGPFEVAVPDGSTPPGEVLQRGRGTGDQDQLSRGDASEQRCHDKTSKLSRGPGDDHAHEHAPTKNGERRAYGADLAGRSGLVSVPTGNMYDPTDPVGRLLFNVLAMVAEFEADLIRSRTREGIRVAKAKGHLRGKQPKLNPRQEAHLVELLYSGEYSTAELGDLFGVARSTVYRAVARSKKPAASGQRAKRHPGTDFTCRADGDRQQLPLWYRQHVDHHIPAAARRSQ